MSEEKKIISPENFLKSQSLGDARITIDLTLGTPFCQIKTINVDTPVAVTQHQVAKLLLQALSEVIGKIEQADRMMVKGGNHAPEDDDDNEDDTNGR